MYEPRRPHYKRKAAKRINPTAAAPLAPTTAAPPVYVGMNGRGEVVFIGGFGTMLMVGMVQL